MHYLLLILPIMGYIPMIMLQIYMSVILFPIAIFGFIIWKYRKKSKKIVKKNILFHASGLISYIISKIRTTRYIDLDYQIENILVIVEVILSILFGLFGILLIIELIKYNKAEAKKNGQAKKKFLSFGKLEDLKSPFVLCKIAIFMIVFGFVMGLTYMENFMGSSYEQFAERGDEPYTLSFSGLSVSCMDSTGNDRFCEDATYIYNPLTRSIDIYCFKVYDSTIKIIDAKPEKLILKEPGDDYYTHFLENYMEAPDSKDNPDYLVGKKYKYLFGRTLHFISNTQVVEEYKNEKHTFDYLLVDFNDDYPEIIFPNHRLTYVKSKDKILGLIKVK